MKDFISSSRGADTFWLSQLIAVNTEATFRRFQSGKNKDILEDTLLKLLFKNKPTQQKPQNNPKPTKKPKPI